MATIQVIKSNKGEIRHVNILASKIVKPLLDKLLNGETINKLAKTFFEEPKIRNQCGRYSCTICGKGFEMERYMKAHMTRMHDTKLNLVKHAVSGHDSDISIVKSERSVSFKTANKSKFKKHKKTTNRPASPERKKLKLASDVSKAIVEEIIEKIQDSEETENETGLCPT